MNRDDFLSSIAKICFKHAYKINSINTIYHVRKTDIVDLVSDVIEVLINTNSKCYKTSQNNTTQIIFEPNLEDWIQCFKIKFTAHTLETFIFSSTSLIIAYYKGYIEDYKDIFSKLPEYQQLWLMLKGVL